MPLYEFRCPTCETSFETLVRSDTKPACPSCGQEKLEKLLSVSAPPQMGGSAQAAPMGAPCGTCHDPRGPGACRFN